MIHLNIVLQKYKNIKIYYFTKENLNSAIRSRFYIYHANFFLKK
jgi:hypothetical protein